MVSLFSRMAAVAIGVGAVAAAQPAFALGECLRFGRISYTADRTVQIAGQTIQSKVYVTPDAEREELTMNGRAEIRLTVGRSQTTFNLENNTGIARSLPPPKHAPKSGMRSREESGGGGTALIVEAADETGTWHEIGRNTCRPDGAVLGTTFTITMPGSSDIVTGQMTQSILSTGPLDPGLFRVPPEVKIKR